MRMSGYALQACTGGRWLGSPVREIFGLSTDTRSLKKGEAFLALRGDRFDGHRFAVEAVKGGASALIGDEAGAALWRDPGPPCLLVEDTLGALGEIAAAWRRELDTTVIALTGSYGKTTVRSMLEHALKRLGLNVAATKANNNNLIGVPQTLLAVENDADAALVECGVSEAGEMRRLAGMTRPDIGIITGLAVAHAEGLGGLRGVVHEKMTLLRHMAQGGYAILGGGVSAILREQGICIHDDVVDMDAADDSVVHWKVHGNMACLAQQGESTEIRMQLPASHWAADLALAATVVRRLTGRNLADIGAALAGWQAVPGRMQRLRGMHGEVIINDAYNANPASMAAALDTLRLMPGRHFAVLGDMAELGDDSDALHAGLDVSGLDGLILTGPGMRSLTGKDGAACWVPDAEAIVAAVRTLELRAGDVVLVKASRCLGLESVVAALAPSRPEAVDAV